MKPSKLFITSLLAAAAMSAVPAWATDVPTGTEMVTTTLEATNTIAEGGSLVHNSDTPLTNMSGKTFTITSVDATSDFAWLGTGAKASAPKNKNFDFSGVSLAGNGDLGIVGTSGGSDFVVNLSGLSATTSFSGRLTVVNQYGKNTTVNIGGTTLQGTEFVFGAEISATDGYRYGSGAGNYTLNLASAASLAGILGTSAKASKESVTVTTAGAVLTLAGAGAYEFYGTVGTSAKAVGISKTGSGTQTLGGTNYLGIVTVSGGMLKLAGTTTINGAVTVSGGTLDVSSGTHTLAGTLTTGENAVLSLDAVTADSAALSATGNVTLSEWTIFRIDSYVAGAQLVSSSGTLAAAGVTSGVVSRMGIANLYIGGYLANQRGSAAFSVSDSGVLTLDSYTEGTNYSLTWNGGDSGVWKANGTGWRTTETTSEATFQHGDSVTFGTGTDNDVTIAENLKVGTMTISDATSLTGTGTVRVDAANLTTTAALTLGENVVLDLGSISAATTKRISGTGTVKVATGSNFKGVSLGTDFRGTIEHTGNIDANTFAGNQNAKYVLSSGKMWSGATLINISNDICFANYQIGNNDQSTTNVNFTGALTQADGTTLTIGGNANTTATFSGAGTVISDLRISAGKLTMNAGQATIKGSQSLVGNLEINNGATVYVAQNDSLSYGSRNTVTVNQGGVLSFGNYRWTVGARNKIVINGGEISGEGDGSNGALDFYEANTEAVTASAGSASTISAAIRLRGVTATFTTNDGATLTLSGPINGAGTLVKAETGELVVSGTNVYTGSTIVNGGVLTVKNASALGTLAAGKSVSVANGAKLQISTSNVNLGNAGEGVVLERGAKLVIDYANLTPTAESTATEKTFEIMTAAVFSIYGSTLSAGDVTNDMTAAWELLGGDSAWLESAKWTLANNTLSLTLTIPEPSMFGLMAGLGALALAGTRRRRRKA